LTDRECVVLARQGQRAALEELVHRYSPGVFNLAVKLLGDREAAADAAQEVFLRVHQSLAAFELARSFRAWLFAIAWNFCRDELRRRRRRWRTFWRPWSAAAGGGEDEAELGAADPGAPSPPELLAGRERRELVREALRRLGPRERGLLVLREFESLSHEELAELAGCEVGAVKSGLHRARLRLKEALVRLCPELKRER
jgi:RNA polymerase sigma-70 factor (ECF subfamily)